MTNSALFGEAQDQDAPPAPDASDTQETPPGGEQDGQQAPGTFLVDKTILPPDAKPGDTLQVQLVRIHDQEAECKIAEPEHEEEPPVDDVGGEPGGNSPHAGMFD